MAVSFHIGVSNLVEEMTYCAFKVSFHIISTCYHVCHLSWYLRFIRDKVLALHGN